MAPQPFWAYPIAAPLYLALNHFYSMNAIDVLVWAVAALVVSRMLSDDQPRLWIVLGVVLGLGLQNKISVMWLGLGAGLVEVHNSMIDTVTLLLIHLLLLLIDQPNCLYQLPVSTLQHQLRYLWANFL